MKDARNNIKCTSDNVSLNGQKFEWYTLDDVVMGGKSNSTVLLTNEGHVEFKGNVNTDGGGFSTCRIKDCDLGLNETHKGVRITYRGNTSDKCIYKFQFMAGNFNFMVNVPAAKDQSSVTHECLLKDFNCMRYGTPKPKQPFIAKNVTGLGLMASIFNKAKPVPGKTGGDFTFILEKIELI